MFGEKFLGKMQIQQAQVSEHEVNGCSGYVDRFLHSYSAEQNCGNNPRIRISWISTGTHGFPPAEREMPITSFCRTSALHITITSTYNSTPESTYCGLQWAQEHAPSQKRFTEQLWTCLPVQFWFEFHFKCYVAGLKGARKHPSL